MPQRKGKSSKPIDVKAMRDRMGLSQTDLVEKIFGERNRTHKRTIRGWEKGEHKPGAMAQQHLQRVQREFDAQAKTDKAAAPTEGAARTKGTRTPADVSDVHTPSRPHLPPGIA